MGGCLLTHRGNRAAGVVWADLRAVLEAPALVSGLQDVAVVCQAVEQGGCHFRVNEDLWPFLEGQVRGDDHRGSLVEPADEMEQ